MNRVTAEHVLARKALKAEHEHKMTAERDRLRDKRAAALAAERQKGRESRDRAVAAQRRKEKEKRTQALAEAPPNIERSKSPVSPFPRVS